MQDHQPTEKELKKAKQKSIYVYPATANTWQYLVHLPNEKPLIGEIPEQELLTSLQVSSIQDLPKKHGEYNLTINNI